MKLIGFLFIWMISGVRIAGSDPASLNLDAEICRPADQPNRVTEYLRCNNSVGDTLTYDEILFRINQHLNWIEERGYPEGLKGLNEGDRSRVLNLCNIDLSGGEFRKALTESVRQPFNRPAMPGAYMPGAILRGVDLRIVDMRGSYLHCIDFRDANLSEADLSGSNIDGSDFSGATLRNTNLERSNMQGVDLDSTYFKPISLMHPEALNDIKGLKSLSLDPEDLSEARLLHKLFLESGQNESAKEIRYAIEKATTSGLQAPDSPLLDRALGHLRSIFLGYLLDYGLSPKKLYYLLFAILSASMVYFWHQIVRQTAGRVRSEVFIKLPAGEPIRDNYGEYQLRDSDALIKLESRGYRAFLDGLFITLVSAVRVAIGPINIAVSLSDIRPFKLTYALTGRSRAIAGVISTIFPALCVLILYY